jgi:diadenosine tetraphosphatase ApaH/serine/threonine PP2A family protein phosphatase
LALVRIAVVSDIHSNIAALEAVLSDAGAGGQVDAIWNMGDLVGYGPEPGACIALLRSYSHFAVAGNHDRAAIGLLSTADFNPVAEEAVLWTARQLDADERDYLAGLPLVARSDEFTLVHGSLRDPVWEYLVDPIAAEAQFAMQGTPYSIVGHSHLPFVFIEEPPGLPLGRGMTGGARLQLADERLIVNPGSVGQPRDGDPRASYILFDSDAATLNFRRVPYDIHRTQEAMRRAGLPEYLIDRLKRGR